jgi:hypothetical protein
MRKIGILLAFICAAAQGNDSRITGPALVTGAIKSNGSGTFGQAAYSDLSSGAPTATTSTLGLVKPDGTVITDTAGVITVPKATSAALGVVQVDGTTISINGSGVISFIGGAATSATTATNLAAVITY